MTGSKNESTESILGAASACFLKQGLSRTRMIDVARIARVSRATIYNRYPSKDELFRAVVEHFMKTALRSAEAALKTERPFRARLTQALDAWFLKTMEPIFEAPHGAELIQAGHELATEIFSQTIERFTQLLTTAFSEAQQQGELDFARTGHSAHTLADLVLSAGNGFKMAQDSKLLKRRLRALVVLIFTALGPASFDQ